MEINTNEITFVDYFEFGHVTNHKYTSTFTCANDQVKNYFDVKRHW